MPANTKRGVVIIRVGWQVEKTIFLVGLKNQGRTQMSELGDKK